MLKGVGVSIAGGVGVGGSGYNCGGRTPSQESIKRPEIYWQHSSKVDRYTGKRKNKIELE